MTEKKTKIKPWPGEERRKRDRRSEPRRAADRIRGLHCWEYHNCQKHGCIVRRSLAQKCWLLCGHEEFAGREECDKCNYKMAWDIGIFTS
jgi:hypothetical protein